MARDHGAARIRAHVVNAATDQTYYLFRNGGPVNFHGYQLREYGGSNSLTVVLYTGVTAGPDGARPKLYARTDTAGLITSNAKVGDPSATWGDVGAIVLGTNIPDGETVSSVTPSAARQDTGCTLTHSSATVADAAAVAGDLGAQITSTTAGLGTTNYIIAVTPGTGYTVATAFTGTTTSGTAVLNIVPGYLTLSANVTASQPAATSSITVIGNGTGVGLQEFSGEAVAHSTNAAGGKNVPDEGVFLPGGLVAVFTGTGLVNGAFFIS